MIPFLYNWTYERQVSSSAKRKSQLLSYHLDIFPGGCLTTMVDWTSSPMSSSVETFRKRGWLVAYTFQGVLGLRGMLLYSGLFNAPGQGRRSYYCFHKSLIDIAIKNHFSCYIFMYRVYFHAKHLVGNSQSELFFLPER